MVSLHELGHFLTAKYFGVLVHEYSIGMGPKLFSLKKGETVYSLRILPIGGYVKLEGENELEENDNPRSFSNLSPIKRIIVLVSGALMNILLGVMIFFVININTGIIPPTVRETPEITINNPSGEVVVSQKSFKVGDEIIKLNNTRTHTYNDVSLGMHRLKSDNLSATVRRDNEIIKLKDIDVFKTSSGYSLGLRFGSEKATILKCLQHAFYDTIYISKAVILSVYDLVTGALGIDSLSGPVEIVSTVGQVTSTRDEYTLMRILLLFAMITVNLGVFNLLPFPALDGGSIVFALYELITRKKVKSEIVGYAGIIGFLLLMVLALYVTIGDILALKK